MRIPSHRIGLTFSLVILLAASACGGKTLPGAPLDPPALASSSGEKNAPTITQTPTLRPSPTPTPLPLKRISQGERLLFVGDYAGALREYQTALAQASDEKTRASALIGIGRTYFEDGQYIQALSNLRQVIENYPDVPGVEAAYFYQGETQAAMDQHEKAAESFSLFLEHQQEPLKAFLLERIGDSLVKAGDYRAAIDSYQAAVDAQNARNVVQLQVRIGRAFLALEDYSSAIRIFMSVYEATDNQYLRAQMNLLAGQAYLGIGEREQAYARYQDSVNNYPRAYDSYQALLALVQAGIPVEDLQRGLTDYFARQYGVAVDAFRRHLNNDPEHGGIGHYYLGLAHRDIQEYSEAISSWQILIQDHPGDDFYVDAWEEIAYTQWAYLDRYDAAAETLLAFVTENPNHAEAASLLFKAAQIYERDGQLTRAAETWERLIQEYPAAQVTYRGLFMAGVTRFRAGQLEQARTIFQRAVLLGVTPADQSAAYFWLAKVQKSQGDAGAAGQSLNTAASLDPTGYYSARAAQLLEDEPPFGAQPFKFPQIDWDLERTKAESWLRVTFSLGPETNLRDSSTLRSFPAFQRALALHDLGLYAEARDEFEAVRAEVKNDPVNTMRLLVPLIDLGYYRSAILASREVLDLAELADAETLTAPAYFNYIRFGMYYDDLVLAAAERENLDPLFLWAVMRQESMFEGHVISSAGASGLMQIMPATGNEIASRLSWPPDYEQSDLYRPMVNVRLGASYMATQIKQFGHPFAALAAYNAGPGNAAYWAEIAEDDPDLFYEVVRFEETRTYIRQIYEFWNIYRRIYSGEAVEVAAR